jgi:GNAT superfamily N-acetyltransferase
MDAAGCDPAKIAGEQAMPAPRERPGAGIASARENRRMDYELDTDPDRIQRDAVWSWLSAEAYWGTWRTREDLEAQFDSAWRVVGAYRTATGEQIGFARAVSDGVGFAYLADVYVMPEFAGHGIGQRMLSLMIDEGPGRDFRWVLFTRDAHTLYEKFGFEAPDETAMVRAAASHMR